MDKKLIRVGEHVRSVDRRWVKRWDNLRIIYPGREHHLSRLELAMKPWLKWTGLILLAAVVGLALAFAYIDIVHLQPGNTPITLDQAVESARQYFNFLRKSGSGFDRGHGIF